MNAFSHEPAARHEPVILMVDPGAFGVSYAINPWMRPRVWGRDPDGCAGAARRSFGALGAALIEAGARLEIISGAEGLPDMVFPANAAVVLDGRALLGRFRPAERRGEEARFAEAFAGLKRRGLVGEAAQLPAGVFQEGAGDCIWDAGRGWFWAGHGQRSTLEAAERVAGFFGREVVALELASPRFYHLDTCFCPLAGGEILYYPPAFTPAALAAIRARVGPDLLIEASDEDAAGLCVNAVSLGRQVVMAKAPPRLVARLAERGYRVREIDLEPFILAGGAAFCMTLRLDLQGAAAPALAVPAQASSKEPEACSTS